MGDYMEWIIWSQDSDH